MYRRMKLVMVSALLICCYLAIPFSWTVAGDLPTSRDLADLVSHVRDLPPRTYDIEVICELNLDKLSEEELRKSVVNIYAQTNDVAPKSETPADRSRQIDQEVKRLLDEQNRIRRIRKRCRFSEEFGYRLEQVIERLDANGGLSTGPVEGAPFDKIYVNVGAPPNKESMQLRPSQRLASLYSKPGARIINDNVWTGGTIGWLTVTLLKLQLNLGKPQEQEQIDLLLKGTHPTFKLQVERDILLPDGTRGRTFVMQVTAEGRSTEVSMDVPPESFNPVWKFAFGKNTRLEVLEAKDGIAQVWIDRDSPGVPAGGIKYILVSKTLNGDIDPALFKFAAPDGYDYVDHTVDPPRTVYADGRVEVGKPTNIVPQVKPRVVSWWPLILGNLAMIAAIIAVYMLKRFKSVSSKAAGKP